MPSHKKKPTHRPHALARMAAAGTAQRICRGCGCTDANACPGGCWWVQPGLCSECAIEEHTYILAQILFGHAVAVSMVRHAARALRAECLAPSGGPAPWPTIQAEMTACLLELAKRATPAERAQVGDLALAELGVGS